MSERIPQILWIGHGGECSASAAVDAAPERDRLVFGIHDVLAANTDRGRSDKLLAPGVVHRLHDQDRDGLRYGELVQGLAQFPKRPIMRWAVRPIEELQ